jgi:hypothetical protein
MIRQVIDEINLHLNYSFKDVLLGVVYPVLSKTQLIPGDRHGAIYVDAVPDDKKRSIVYWEDYGTTTTLSTPRYDRFQTRVRLVCWMNFKLLNHQGYDECVREMFQAVPKRFSNKFIVKRKGYLPKTHDIFSRYNYREGKQFIAPPYDVFALEFDITHMSVHCGSAPYPTPTPTLSPTPTP